MAEQDTGNSFLGTLKDFVNAAPVLGAWSQAAWGPGNYDPASIGKPLEPLTPGSFVSGVLPGRSIGFYAEPVLNSPIGAPLKFALDFGNRTVDSLYSGLHEVERDADGGFLDGWRASWDSWGTPSHVSFGTGLGARLNDESGTFENIDFSAPDSAARLRAMSERTWYGSVAGGVADLSAGFVGPGSVVRPVVKARQGLNALDTAAKVEKTADSFNDAAKAGSLDALRKQAGQSFVRSTLDAPLTGESYAARLRDLAYEAKAASTDMTSAMNFFGPRMSRATEQSKRIMAETAVYANQLDDASGTHLLGNTWLALMGSSRAADEVIATAPLVMDKIANAAGAPADIADAMKAQEVMLRNFQANGDLNVSAVMDEVYSTPKKQAIEKALRDRVERARYDAEQAKALRNRVAAARPRFRTKVKDGFREEFDVARLKESRTNAAAQVQDLTDRLKEAREGGSSKDLIDDLKTRLDEARSDRDLLDSTPLNDPDALSGWQSSMTASRKSVKQADYAARWYEAELRTTRRQLDLDRKAAKRLSPTLDATHLWLSDVFSVANGTETMVGNVGSSMLAKMKTRYRERVGATYTFDAGDYNSKVHFHKWGNETIANIGTAYGRRAVNTHDLYKGQQELAMYLKKSGAFDGDEIRAYVNQYLSTSPDKLATVVERAGDEMTKRMLLKAGYDPRQIDSIVKDMRTGANSTRGYLTNQLAKADSAGDDMVRTNEFPGEDSSSDLHMQDAAFLRPHLSDTVAFPDPYDIKRYIHADQKRYSMLHAKDVAAGAIDTANYWWKVFNLVRPGLFFRNMLDTGLRAQMLIGTMPYTSAAVNGALHKVRNLGVRVGDWTDRATEGSALERVGARLGPETVAKTYLGDKGVQVARGDGSFANVSLYDRADGHATAASLAAVRGASTRGASLGDGIMGTGLPLHDRLVKEASQWDRYKAMDHQWPFAYRDHAQALLSSPTARRMIELETARLVDDVNVEDLTAHLFKDPAVREEYSRLAANLDMPREAFVEQVLHEMDNMFPEAGMAEDVLAGRLQGRGADKWVEEHFPIELRFDLPGRKSVLGGGESPRAKAQHATQKALDAFFKNVVDEPDFWLVRHPVMVRTYSSQVKKEASTLLASRRAKYGDDAVLTDKDIATIDRRSKAHAIGVVKDYMYDATYSTGLTQVIHRVAPFFNPWYDAARAYSKLIADDPQRLANLAGIWNAPTNISQHLAEPLVVDINGNEVRTGEEPGDGGGERFFVLNSVLGKAGAGLQLRQSSFNTILMGETPWLPGWGPALTVPLASGINTNKDLALWLSQRDDPILGSMMKSLWPDGQIPESDAESLFNSALPATWRKVGDVTRGGKTYWTNVQYALNAQYIESVRTGRPFDPKAARLEAERQASTAGWFSVMSQGIFGISAKSDVDGAFYANRMREYQSMTPEALGQLGYPTPQAAFMAEYPEAAGLTWTFTKNETGVNATITAQSHANRLRPLIDNTPDMGWFIVGAENVGGDFSQTAYNQQKQFTYGITQEGRKVLDPGEVMQNTLAGIGWDQYQQAVQMIETVGVEMGASKDILSSLKRTVAERIGTSNPQWFEEYNSRENRIADFFNKADLIASDPRMAGRQDMGMYREYRAVRDQVLGLAGLSSLTGTSANSEVARTALRTIGEQLAARDFGFQQMWTRVLSHEVEPKGDVNVDTAVTPAA